MGTLTITLGRILLISDITNLYLTSEKKKKKFRAAEETEILIKCVFECD